MKIRNGFVSNSSTTSFCIYGTTIGRGSIELPGEDDDVTDYLETLFSGDSGLDVYSFYDDDCTYVGKSWDSIGDDETGKQFKDRVEAIIKAKLPNVTNFNCYQEARYDG